MADPQPTKIAIAVVEHDGRFLIGLRPEGVPLAGLWEFPGGKVEPGESPAEAALRECAEETGLAITIDGEYPQAVHQYDHGKLRLHFFRCRALDASVEPTDRFRWVDRNSLRDYQFPAANAALVELLVNS